MTIVDAENTKIGTGAEGWEHEPRWTRKDKTTSFRQTITVSKHQSYY